MSITRAILIGAAIALLLSLVTRCSMKRVETIQEQVEKLDGEAFSLEYQKIWCEAQVHKCSQAHIAHHISDLEKEVLSRDGAAIWVWHHGK